MKRDTRNAIGAIAVILAVGYACKVCKPTSQSSARVEAPATVAAPAPADDAELVIARCGTPAKDDSTANDNPRPPIPTLILDYPKAKLHVIFTPVGKLDTPPPIRWRFLAFTDTKTDEPVHAVDAAKRLPCLAGDAGFPFDAGK